MGISVTYDGIEEFWKDDYYFCEDKILANVANYFGCRHELMFGGGFNFGYEQRNGAGDKIGNHIAVKYFEERELLEKYYGVVVRKYNYDYGPESFLALCKIELGMGKPVAVGLENCNVWPVKQGEEEVRLLPFLIIGIHEDNSVEVIDSHELGVRRTLTKEIFQNSYRWGACFDKKPDIENTEVDVKEFIRNVLKIYQSTVTAKQGCVDVDLSFSSISSNQDMFESREGHDPVAEMHKLADDIRDMELDVEISNLNGVLWVPFYFDLLLLYRSRLVFTKALREVEERAHTHVFQSIIERLVVASSKWNYLRMVFTNCYHNKKMDMSVKENIASVIHEIAEHEKSIYEEFKEIYHTYDAVQEHYYPVDLSQYYNTYIFDHANWRNVEEDKAVYGRYFYEGQCPLGGFLKINALAFHVSEANEKGDSLVCLGQTITLKHEAMSAFQGVILCGSVLYNEMIYDYMKVLYADGSRENICIGFNGWIENAYRLEDTGVRVWSGNVVKREDNEATDPRRKAVIYAKEYILSKDKNIVEIVLPNNPFIHILGLILVK